LVAIAEDHWRDFDGWAASQGVDPEELEYERFVNLIWYWLMRDRDDKERASIESRLYLPPRGITPTTGPWSAQAEMASFSSLKQALGM
jgi:hypothetical protein